MKTILLFDKKIWDIRNVKEYIKGNEYGVRFGFSHILVVFNNFDCKDLTKSNNEVLCIEYDKKTNSALNECFLIKDGKQTSKKLKNVLREESNAEWDLKNFGFLPQDQENMNSLLDIYSTIIESPISSNADMLSNFDCRDLIANEDIENKTRKHLIDVFGLIAAGFQIIVSMQENINILKQYAGILACVFIARAKFEKMIFLVSALDTRGGYYDKVVGGTKKLKSTFLRHSKDSKLPITARLQVIARNFDHFDEQFRTPEAHKNGRLFPLISDGHYNTLINEVLSFENELNQFFGEVVGYMRVNLHNESSVE